ncbi:MAG: hypothetical protein AAFU81_16920, partial [Pseudomonadota bacterium]
KQENSRDHGAANRAPCGFVEYGSQLIDFGIANGGCMREMSANSNTEISVHFVEYRKISHAI